VLRRRRSATADGSDPGSAGSPDGTGSANGSSGKAGANGRAQAATAGKGRPTPKRSEAERRRRQPYTAPTDRKEAARAARNRGRDKRVSRMDAMRRGEDWALAPKDRGPVRALARDYVDSRRRISEFYLYAMPVLLVFTFMGSRSLLVQSLIPLFVMAAALLIFGEGYYLRQRIRALAQERLPGESTRGIGMYVAMRALQMRRLRVPKPRVKPGDSF
jgi:Protein of unknown function (DUF3043)